MNFKRKNHHGAVRRNDTSSWNNPITYERKATSAMRTFSKRTKVCKATKALHIFTEVKRYPSWWNDDDMVYYRCLCGKKDTRYLRHGGEVETQVIANHLRVGAIPTHASKSV